MIDSLQCLFLVNRLSPGPWRLVFFTPIACLVLLALFMLVEGLKNPEETAGMLIFDWVWGAIWLVAISRFRLGIDLRDVVERGNHRASWVIAAAQLAATLCFGLTFVLTPEDMEDGPVLLLGMGCTIVLYAFWTILEWLTCVAEAVTVEREGGAALRLAAFLVAEGLLLGVAFGQLPPLFSSRAVFETGASWIKPGMPVALLLLALLLERHCQRYPGPPCSPPEPRDGVIACFFLGVAGLWLFVTR
jgi:hypothetical protein